MQIAAIIAVCLIGISVANSQLIESVYIWNVERSLSLMAQNAENAGADYFPLLYEYETQQGVSIDLYDNVDNYLYEGNGNFISGNKINIISRKENDDGSYFNVVSTDGSTTQYIVYGKDFENGYHILPKVGQKILIKQKSSTPLPYLLPPLLDILYHIFQRFSIMNKCFD